MDTNVTQFTQLAVLMSPLYNRSHDWHSECLKFRYMLRGPGKKTLTIYQKTKTYRGIPIWISGSNTGKNWLYGQVPLNSLSEFQVYVSGYYVRSMFCSERIKYSQVLSTEKYEKHLTSCPSPTAFHCILL